MSYLRFCFCLMSLVSTGLQGQSPRPSTSGTQSRVSHIIPQTSETEILRRFIAKLNALKTIEITRHVVRILTRSAPRMQGYDTILQTMCYFKSVQHLRLEGCLEKSDSLKQVFSSLRLCKMCCFASTFAQMLSCNKAHYQNLQKVCIVSEKSIISESIASALTSAKKLTHIYIAATFSSAHAMTILVQESPKLMDFSVDGKVNDSSSRHSLNPFKKWIKSELTK